MPLQATPSNPVADNVLPQQAQPQFNISDTYIKVLGSNFGYLDGQDPGKGKWMDDTNNQKIVGCSIPIKSTASLFNGQDAKHKLIEVHNPLTGKTIIAPLVDVGPHESVKYGLDLTYAAFTQLGGTLTIKGGHVVGGDHLSEVYYRVLSPEEQNQFKHLSNGMSGAQHNISSPMKSLQKSVDLVAGNNTTRNEAIAQLMKGQVPDHAHMVENSAHGTNGEAGQETNVVHTPTNITPSPVNTSGAPKGMFSIPEVGAMLWVFFRNGDPQYPVYFAASYGAEEWGSAYSASSPPLYYPGNDPKKLQKTDQAIMMPNKGGGMQFTEALGDSGNSRGMKIFGYSGAHLEFNEQHNIYYSPHDDYHQSDGHKFDVVKSNRELFTQGDCNFVTVGDLYIKVGNITKSAMQAMDNIHEAINNINDKMAGGGGGSGGAKSQGGAGSTKKSGLGTSSSSGASGSSNEAAAKEASGSSNETLDDGSPDESKIDINDPTADEPESSEARANSIPQQLAREESNSTFAQSSKDEYASPSEYENGYANSTNSTYTSDDYSYNSDEFNSGANTTSQISEPDNEVTSYDQRYTGYTNKDNYEVADNQTNEVSVYAEDEEGYRHNVTYPDERLNEEEKRAVKDGFNTDNFFKEPSNQILKISPDGQITDAYKPTWFNADVQSETATVTQSDGTVVTKSVQNIDTTDTVYTGGGSITQTTAKYDEEGKLIEPGKTIVTNADGVRAVTAIDGIPTGVPSPVDAMRVEHVNNNAKLLDERAEVRAQVDNAVQTELKERNDKITANQNLTQEQKQKLYLTDADIDKQAAQLKAERVKAGRDEDASNRGEDLSRSQLDIESERRDKILAERAAETRYNDAIIRKGMLDYNEKIASDPTLSEKQKQAKYLKIPENQEIERSHQISMQDQVRKERSSQQQSINTDEKQDYSRAIIRDANGNLVRVKIQNGKIISQ